MSAARAFLLTRHTAVLNLVRLGIPFEVAQDLTPAQRVAWLDAAEVMKTVACVDDDQLDPNREGNSSP